ncbi:MAG TPA: RpoL/Rpb11 RNA polymerase subunit family protein [Candidatus Nitrosotalea sp.]|jgi:DNA-directed RNA polymerase subunit L|nr:RpoL/Rpb11 RNA polymerase subunit family protein [Nitrososphaeraceae archaeon]HXU95226.1 RpoL/Rpb11 RNA polymerase subunit family protein [Candidatus Nitrosotalea sp.]
MDVLLKKSSPKEVQLDITKSDISTLYIVQYEMLKDPTVEFAGVVLKHPLTKLLSMRVNTSKGNPVKEIEKATKTAMEYTDELKKAIFSKIKGV